MSNAHITYLVAAGCGVICLFAFITLVVVPALASYRRAWERAAAFVLSLYVLGALVSVGLVAGALIVIEWPRVF
jgi:hypothetical protein